jgi:hypothetical protein
MVERTPTKLPKLKSTFDTPVKVFIATTDTSTSNSNVPQLVCDNIVGIVYADKGIQLHRHDEHVVFVRYETMKYFATEPMNV